MTKGILIARRLFALRDSIYTHADKTHAVKFEEIRAFYKNNRLIDSKFDKIMYDDLHALQKLGVRVRYDEKSKGWLVDNPPFEANELRLIVDSVQASKFITQTEAKRLTDKITKNFGIRRLQNLNRQAYVYDRIRSQNDEVVKQADHFYEAIGANRKISFRYFRYTPDRRNPKSYSKSGENIIVSPFALYWSSGNLYLYAYDGKKMRFYRVDRMERISKPLQQTREGHDLFSTKSLTQQKAKVFDMYSTGKVYNVKFRCHNHIAPAVIDQFGKDTMMMTDDAEHFTFTKTIDISPPFFAWVATFGRSIQIVSPAPVVDEMRSFLQKSMDMYKDDGAVALRHPKN